MKWTIPKMWDGATVSILASGPSMNAAVVDSVHGEPTIAINTTFQLAPWATMLYAADGQWWERYRKTALNFAGLKVTLAPEQFPELLTLQRGHLNGLDLDPTKVNLGGNSGYQAVCIAATAGAKRINLYGFDMRSDVKHHHHWHGVHPSPLRNHGESIYERWIKNFNELAPILKSRGVEVVNCTPASALKCFPFHVEPTQMAA